MRFLMKLAGETVTIETKTGSVVRGIVTGVDMHMNVHLRRVELRTKESEEALSHDVLSIRGSTVRYIILPEAVNLNLLLVDDSKKVRPPAPTGAAALRGRGRGFRGRGGPPARGGPGAGPGRVKRQRIGQ